MKMYCVYDKKAEVMNPPFTQDNNAFALRQFQIMVNRPGTDENINILNMYASDFALLYLGDFDQKSCKFTPADPVVTLSTGDELLTPPPILIKYKYGCYLPAFAYCDILTKGKLCISHH